MSEATHFQANEDLGEGAHAAANTGQEATRPERERTCASCPFYGTTRQDCRRHPPVGHLIHDKKRQAQFLSFFPPTRPGDWCGEHPLRKLEERGGK